MMWLGRAAALALLAVTASPAAARAPAIAVATPIAHERLIALEGGQNFRDLGGYRTADGHSVKWGVLFRSGRCTG